MEFHQEYLLIPNTVFGDLQVRYYGIIIVTAMLIAAGVAARLANSRNFSTDHIWGGLTWAIFPGIIFARLWFVLFPPISLTQQGIDTAWFFENFFNLENGAIAIWSGGLHIFGAVLGGLLGVWLYLGPLHNPVARAAWVIFYPVTLLLNFIFWVPTALFQLIMRREVTPFELPKFETNYPDSGMPMLPWLDIAAVALPVAQAIGRWANYVNQELYGSPTTLPWGIRIDSANRVGEYRSMVEYPAETLFHPIFLYEALWSLAAFIVLYRLYMNKREDFNAGDFFLLYIMQYSVIRFLLEFLRVEIAYIPGTEINSAQVGVVIAFVLALIAFVVRRRNGVSQPTMPPIAYDANLQTHTEPAA